MQTKLSRKTATVALAALGGVALLLGGAAVGYALNDSDSDEPATRLYLPPTNRAVASGAQDDGAADGAIRGEIAAVANSAGGAADVAIGTSFPALPGYGGCPVAVEGVSAGGNAIDLSGSGFSMNILGEGFELRSIGVRGEADCDEDGNPANGRTVLDTQWEHTASGYEVYLSQRESAEEQPNVRYDSSLSFWLNGYHYTASVMSHPIMPFAGEIATSPPEPADDPQVQAALDAIVTQLAPDLGAQCFYTQREGAWEDLAGLGIGDPRAALPDGFTEESMNLSAFDAPADGCPGVGLDVPPSAGFNASFAASDGSVWIVLGASPAYEGATAPGYLSGHSANWSNGNWHFYVSYESYSPDGETIRSLATALDPSFSDTCLIQERELDASELAGLGFNQPVGPDGYEITDSWLRVTELPEGCSSDAEGYPSYNLNWTIGDGTHIYDAGVGRYPIEAREAGAVGASGSVSDHGIHWTAEDGTYYWVSLLTGDSAAEGNRETMLAIAQSLDPSLDPNSLEEQPDWGRPAPLPYGGVDDAGGGAGADGATSSNSGAASAPSDAVSDD